jgi:hypothetical protein
MAIKPASSCAARNARLALSAATLALLCAAPAHGQSLEPRTYSPGPVGLNFLVLGVTDSEGGLSIDPALPVSDANLSVQNAVLGYARTIDLFGTSGKIDAVLPYGRLSGSAVYQGERIERKVDGFGDPLLRLSALLHGAPALSPAEFKHYRQHLVVGTSVQVSVPVGQYDGTRVLNLGANRWFVKPEVGVSQLFGRWSVELTGAATIYGPNRDFFGGHRRTQTPLYAAQTHIVYSLRSGIWAALDATWFGGGATSIDGGAERNLQRNWRLGLTAAVPVNRRISLKANASTGVSARTGNDFNLFGLALQYRWGAGL